jgi:uncharacterized protein (DUF697 family)
MPPEETSAATIESFKDDPAGPASSAASDLPVKPEERDEFGAKLVDRFAIWSGVAGLIPLPVVDVLAVGGLQLQMLRRLSQIYDVPFSENRGKALIASLAGAMIPTTSSIGAGSALKAVPFVGWAVAGFVMPVLSAGATYAIGKAFIQHFASGGTLLDFNPPDYREFIKAHREMWDSKAPASRAAAAGEGATAGQQRGAPDAPTDQNAGNGATRVSSTTS